MTIHLREKLDSLLFKVENGSDETLRAQIAWMIDILPENVHEINKHILILDKPKLASSLGNWPPLTKTKALKELRDFRRREDLIGRISDLMFRIATDAEDD